MSTTEENEHWRLRLVELVDHIKATRKLNQRQIAEEAGMTPDYLSRLLYEQGKKGRKNLGMDTMRRLCAAFNLPANWFDLPLKSAPPGWGAPAPSAQVVNEPIPLVRPTAPGNGIVWPFPHVTYQRLMDLKAALGPKMGHDAMIDIAKTLEIQTLKWELEATRRKSPAG